jgi:hypothetical protein
MRFKHGNGGMAFRDGIIALGKQPPARIAAGSPTERWRAGQPQDKSTPPQKTTCPQPSIHVLVSFVQTQPTAPDRPHPTPQADPGPASDAHPHRAILDDLIALATNVARHIHNQIVAEPDRTATPDLATAFDRVARGVRRTILLCQHLDTPPKPQVTRTIARKKIIRYVEDEIARITDAPETAEPLREALRERLDEPDLDDDIANRPIREVIEEICRDLGISDDCGLNLWQPRGATELAALRDLATRPTPPPTPPTPRPLQIHRGVNPDEAEFELIGERVHAAATLARNRKRLGGE